MSLVTGSLVRDVADPLELGPVAQRQSGRFQVGEQSFDVLTAAAGCCRPRSPAPHRGRTAAARHLFSRITQPAGWAVRGRIRVASGIPPGTAPERPGRSPRARWPFRRTCTELQGSVRDMRSDVPPDLPDRSDRVGRDHRLDELLELAPVRGSTTATPRWASLRRSWCAPTPVRCPRPPRTARTRTGPRSAASSWRSRFTIWIACSSLPTPTWKWTPWIS